MTLSAKQTVDLHEFDYVLHEQSSSSTGDFQQRMSSSNRQMIVLGGEQEESRTVILASSTTVSPTEGQQQSTLSASSASPEATNDYDYDPYQDLDIQEQQYNQIQSVDQPKPTLEGRLKQMDLQDVVVTLVIPAIISFAGLRWGFNKVADRIEDKADTLLEGFAKEMVFHDGDFEEMRMCHADYSKKLLWMGPKKNEAMLKRYLKAYAKRKTVSPQAIR